MFPPKKIATALIAIGVGSTGISFVAHAQQAQKVDKIEVTGSNIKRVDSETPSPIQVITRDDIQKSGANSVAELLRDMGGDVKLAGLSPYIHAIFRSAGAHESFDYFVDAAQAVRSFDRLAQLYG